MLKAGRIIITYQHGRHLVRLWPVQRGARETELALEAIKRLSELLFGDQESGRAGTVSFVFIAGTPSTCPEAATGRDWK